MDSCIPIAPRYYSQKIVQVSRDRAGTVVVRLSYIPTEEECSMPRSKERIERWTLDVGKEPGRRDEADPRRSTVLHRGILKF